MQNCYFNKIQVVLTEHFQCESRKKWFVMLRCVSVMLHKPPAIRETFAIYFAFLAFLTRRSGFMLV